MPRNRDNSYNSGSYGYGDSYTTSGSGTARSGRYDGYDYTGYYQDSGSAGYGTGMSGFGTAAASTTGVASSFGNFDKLQEQLTLRESQLAMASNLLEQQSRLIADVSTNITGDRDRDRDRRYGAYDRKRSGSDNRNDNKRRRTESGSYGDDRRDGRRGYGGRQGGGDWRSPRSVGGGGGGGGRQGNRQGGGGGRGQMAPRNKDNRRSGGGGAGGGGGRGGNMNRSRRPQGNRRNSQGDNKKNVTPKKPKIIPRVSKELSRHYCHICEVECFNERNYQNHLSGTRHKEKADELDDNPTRKAEVEARMKKQEEERSKPVPVKESVDHCDICDLDIHVALSSHLKFKQHRHRETQVKRGCAWCNVGGFSNFSEVLAHRLTDQHKSMREQFGGKIRPDTIPKPEYTELDEIPAFVEDTPQGKDYVVPVTGFFCKLCNKFYKKEEAAKQNHCSSESHYDKWKQAKIDAVNEYQQKLAEQKEREEAAMIRIEEQAKKREEEKKKKAENAENAENPETNGDVVEEKMETDGEAATKTDAETMETETETAEQTETAIPTEETEESAAAPTTEEEELMLDPSDDVAAPIEEDEEKQLLSKEDDADGEGDGEADEWVGETEEVQTPTKRGRRGRQRAGRGRGKK